MIFNELKIKGVFEILTEPYFDQRGFFMRTYDEEIFKKFRLHKKWVQESQSLSRKKGTVRGFHFQHPPYIETKLIRVVSGKILFTVLDLRDKSSTFGQWVQLILSAQKKNLLYVPKGCVSCMCTLENNSQVIYKMDEYFNPKLYDNVYWNDPDLKIPWPIQVPEEISEKDSKAQSFKEFIKKYKSLKVQ
jgi:dTDP-4-dehydrorhamnose 3,5-epimerase